MARYINEKDVYKLVEPTGVARVHCSQIDELPRADVVPKSEVEELIRENESLAKTVIEASELIRKLRSKVKKSKTEVAREIFEDIDNNIGIGHDVIDIFDILAELKKKYTEGEE